MDTSPGKRDSSIEKMPKIDLHRHLEGSIRTRTILEVAEEYDLDVPRDESSLARTVQVSMDDPRNHTYFLERFDHIRKVFQSPDVIQQVVRETIEDAAADNVCYLELRFTPAALIQMRQFAIAEVIDWVVDAAKAACEEFSIRVGLIASINRHEDPGLASEVLECIEDHDILGIDLAGDEVRYASKPFQNVFQRAKSMGLGVVVHAGEWASAENVREAILAFDANRIGHGVRVLDDPAIVELARDRGIFFEVSLWSNYLTGVVERLEHHPFLSMLQAGLRAVLTTDDPGIFQTTLSQEYHLAAEHFDISQSTMKALTMTAVQASFLPTREKRELEEQMVRDLWGESL